MSATTRQIPSHSVYQAGDPYDPIVAGSIDGTDIIPHDRAIERACNAHYDPKKDPKIRGDPRYTIFVGRISYETTEETLENEFGRFGEIRRLRLVRDIVTGLSKGYAFIEYEHSSDGRRAHEKMHRRYIDGRHILVDIERERSQPSWVPRRLGGGLGGRKESGQLRFGGRDRPHRLPHKENKLNRYISYSRRNSEHTHRRTADKRK